MILLHALLFLILGKGGKNDMAIVYAVLIVKGKKTFADVPAKINMTLYERQKGGFCVPERWKTMKMKLLTVIGLLGSWIASLFGGWDAALVTLLIFMGIDYLTGLIVAGVFKNSEKTDNGALESRAGWKGLCRKGVTLLVVLVACRLDLVMGSNFIRDAVVIAFIANETISIIENAGLMGIPVPAVIMQAIEVLKKKTESEGDGE